MQTNTISTLARRRDSQHGTAILQSAAWQGAPLTWRLGVLRADGSLDDLTGIGRITLRLTSWGGTRPGETQWFAGDVEAADFRAPASATAVAAGTDWHAQWDLSAEETLLPVEAAGTRVYWYEFRASDSTVLAAGQLVVRAGAGSDGAFLRGVDADQRFATLEQMAETDQRLAALEHVPMDITGFSVSPAVVEAGATVTSLTFSWGRNKAPVSLSINQGIGTITPTLTTVTKTVSIAADTTYTLTADDGTTYAGHADTASAAVQFQRKMHWGTSAAQTLDSAGILALASSAFATSRARSVTVNGGGQYLYFAYPASFGDASFLVNGLTNTAWTKTVVSHTNASSGTVNYNIYRSDSIQFGAGIQITTN